MYTRATHSPIHPYINYILWRVVWGGGWSQSGQMLGERRGIAWTDSQFITALTHGHKQPFMLTFTPTGSLESPINLRVSGLWEEAPRGNPHRERTSTQKNRPAGLKPRTVQLWGDIINTATLCGCPEQNVMMSVCVFFFFSAWFIKS